MITQERLKELLSYAPLTGVFLWKKSLRGRFAKAGAAAGYPDQKDGYLCICVDQRQYRVHRLAWFYMTGEWPKGQIDHKDLDKSNNRFSNLRDATKSQNMWNLKCRSNSATGVKGVQYDARRGLYYAKITANGRKTWLGYHQTAEAAAEAYRVASIEKHQEFARAA